MLSGHGGIGRRVRLRGVWLHRPSSSLGDRTTKISTDLSVLFILPCGHRHLNLCAIFAHNNALHCSDGTVRVALATVSELTPLAITLVSLATSLGGTLTKLVPIYPCFLFCRAVTDT